MIADHNFKEDAKSLLLPQFSRAENLKNILGALVEPFQGIRDGAYQISEGYDIETAEGVQLDVLGENLNVERQERSDEEYRDAIKARILINNSKGTSSDFIRMLKLVLGDIEFTVIENPSAPAQVQVIIYSPQNVINEELVNDITPCGVKGLFLGNPYDDKQIFQLGDVDGGGNVIGGTPMVDVADLATTDVTLINVIYF